MQNSDRTPAEPSCYGDDYRVFKIEDGETHWLVEMLADEALEAHASEMGYESVEKYIDDMDGDVTCEPVLWNQEITVMEDDGNITKLARDWAVTHRGSFCSTAY